MRLIKLLIAGLVIALFFGLSFLTYNSCTLEYDIDVEAHLDRCNEDDDCGDIDKYACVNNMCVEIMEK